MAASKEIVGTATIFTFDSNSKKMAASKDGRANQMQIIYEESEDMVTVSDNDNMKKADLQQHQISATEAGWKLESIIEEPEDTVTQSDNVVEETEAGAEIPSTSFESATQSDFEIQQYVSIIESDDSSSNARLESGSWEDVSLSDYSSEIIDENNAEESSVRVDIENSELVVSESSDDLAFNIFIAYLISVLHAFNSFWGKHNNPPVETVTEDNNKEALNSEINENENCSVDIPDDCCCEGFPLPSLENNESTCDATPEQDSQAECPYAFPVSDHNNNSAPSNDWTIDLYTLILAVEVVGIILCIITFFYKSLTQLENNS